MGEEDSDSHEDSVYDSFYTVWKASKDLFPAAPLWEVLLHFCFTDEKKQDSEKLIDSPAGTQLRSDRASVLTQVQGTSELTLRTWKYKF